MSIRDFCVALLAGGVGAGGAVVAVQAPKPAPKPAIVRKAPARPVARRATPVTPAPKTPSLLADCPPAISWDSVGGTPDISILRQPGHPPSYTGWHGGGGGFTPSTKSPTPDITPPMPAVPEPQSWVMLVAGFGMIAVALRRRETRHG